jgi:PAS domain S-box-containing protein
MKKLNAKSMNTQSTENQNIELQKIKQNLLDAFLKIKISQVRNDITLIECNQKAIQLLKIKDESNVDILQTLKNKLTSKINWIDQLNKVIHGSDLSFTISDNKRNANFHISMINLLENTVMINIREAINQQSDQFFSEEKFTKAFHANPSLMAITTAEGHAIDLNESFIKATGYSRESFLNKEITAWDLVEDPNEIEKLSKLIKTEGKARNFSITIKSKDDKLINCLLSADYLKTPNAKRLLVVLNDISQQHQLSQRLDMAMKTAQLSWYEFDMINGTVTAGDNKAQMLGYNPNDFENKHYSVWTDLIHPLDYGYVMNSMKACIAKETDLYEVDYRIKRADGKYAWFFDRGMVCEYTMDGEPKRMTGIVVNISERKATERKLKQTLRDYEHATNNVRSIIWKTEITKDGKFINTFISKVADKILGYEEESLNNDLYKYLSHIHPDDKEITLENIKKGMQVGEKSEFEYRVIKKDGEVAWLFTQGSTETDDEGRVLAFGVTIDMSQRKKAEIEIKKQQKFLHQLIDTIPSMIAVKNEKGKYTNVNTQFANFYNLSPEFIIGKSDDEFIEKSLAKELSENDKSILDSGVPHYYSLSQKTNEGEKFFEIAKVPIKNLEGTRNQLLIVSNDITEIKNQELNIQKNLSRQKALSNVAFQLSELKDFEKNINKSLAIIGQFMNVSRVYIFRNSEDNNYYSNVFEWCNQGVESQINNLQNVSYGENPSWKENLAANEPIYTNDIQKLSPELSKELEPQGIKSVVLYPLFIFNEFSGFIGFDENTKNREWSEYDFEFLQTISHIIANTYERKIIGDNLRESEEMFKKITSGAMDGIVLIDSVGKVNYWNPAAENIFGYSRDEMTGTDLHKLLTSATDGEKYEANKIQFSKTGTGNAVGKKIELKALHKKGNQIDIELSLSSLKIKGEWHALGIVRDITERKYAENQLKTLSKAVEYASASIVITNINGNIEYVNQKFVETTGYTKKEVIGKNPRILSSGKHPKHFYKNLWQTIKQGKEWKGEFHNKRKNGETYYESALISSVTDEEGNILHYIGIKEDITNEKIATIELVKAKQNAEMANKAKSDFLANMSHEIRTPMNAVIGFSEILANKIDNEEHKTYLESIQASSKTLLNLINDILDLSKIEAGQMKIQTEAVSLKQIIQDITQIFSLKIQQKNLALVLDIDPNIPEQIIIDELRLRQILLNLLGNAVKFTEEGFIKIIAEKAKTNDDGSIKLIIRVQDSGIGIDDKNQQAIFEAFRQQENHNTRKYGGTGLGLSITKRLIEIQGGTIALESKLGEGSTFSVIFDNLKTSSKQFTDGEAKPNENQEYIFNHELVLIVDDVPSNRFLLKSYLAELNLTMQEAENGAEAVEMVRNQKPDIILMDLRMPVMNGLDATKEIKRIPSRKDTPIIAVTASSMHFEDEDIEASGFDGFLDKPVSRDQIINELIKHIKPKQQLNSSHQKIDKTKFESYRVLEEHKGIINTHLAEALMNVKNSGNMNDIMKLAEQIKTIGNNKNIEAFIKAADALLSASKSFDIESIQDILNQFHKYCE